MPDWRPWGESLLHSPWRWGLLPLWLGFRPLVAMRNACFDLGWRRPQRLTTPVICVGNLTAGGTGKTPLVAWLGAALRAAGERPAVISRGYRGVDGTNDEARTSEVPVFCDSRRVRAGWRAIAEGASCLLMDDGFQHRQLHRDIDVVCIDATRPWGRSNPASAQTLPLGLLREGPRALRRADAIVLTRCDQVGDEVCDGLVADLGRWGQAVFRCRHQPAALQPLATDEQPLPPTNLRGRRVLAVAGIANPVAFFRSLADAGAAIVDRKAFPDHHAYSPAELDALHEQARAVDACLLTTAKDAVKWTPAGRTWPPGSAYALKVELAFLDNDSERLWNWLKGCLASRQDVAGASPRNQGGPPSATQGLSS